MVQPGVEVRELMGGLRNALERGEDIVSAQRTFVNAGYPTSLVASAARLLADQNPELAHQQRSGNVGTSDDLPVPVPLVKQGDSGVRKPRRKRWLLWTVIILLILAGALVAGFLV